ncbi:glycine zipper 2TM domain-containing protein [Aureimonas fodinaquatilis]|uniref:17 kDa surface antigen n=1 Tax=Aureimonas fodinaquatilis TaxID=2565783 RepID=A0A5B0DSQ3_9HYPH|nr:glycine zipper 2TM domain-containing protein [Aureimonas fodinaquatilis]
MRKASVALGLAGMLALAACQSTGTSSEKNQEFNCMAGTIGGAVVGGLLGSTIGGGSGRVVGAALGAGGGGLLGNRLACQ